MGKGNRNRKLALQKEAEDRFNHPENYQKKNKKNNGRSDKKSNAWISVLAIVLIAVLLAGSISLIIIYENGVIFRSQKAMKSEHYKITGTMMQYFYYYQYQNTYSTYYNMALTYMGSADYISYFGWNLNSGYAHDDEVKNACKLGEAKKDEDGNDMKDANGNTIYDSVAITLRGGTVYTWWDYFMDLAIKQAQETLVYCEAAYAEGYTTLESLAPNAKSEIDEVIDGLKANAKEAGYSTSAYVKNLYGNGVSVGDIRKALELSYIASEYTALVEDRLNAGITSEEIDKQYNDNKYDYHFADALTLSMNLSYDDILEGYVKELGDDYETAEYNEAVAKAEEEYEKRLAHFREIAPKFEQTKNNRELFEELITEIYAYMYYYDCFNEKTDKDISLETAVTDALAFYKTMTDETEVEKDGPLAERIASFIYTEMEELLFEDMTCSDNSDLTNWAFKAVEQQEGNVLILITETDGTETKQEYSNTELTYVDIEEDESDEDESDKDESDKDTTEEDTSKDESSEDSDKEDEKHKSEYEGEEYDFGAYYMITPGARDTYKALELGFIVITVEDHDHEEGEEVDHEHVDAEALANEYLTELLAKGELTPDVFEAFAKEKEAENYNVVEDYLKGDFGYDEMDEWAFAEASRVGTGAVVPIYAGNTEPLYYAVVYCFSEGEEAWRADAKGDILLDKYDAWDAEVSETYLAQIVTADKVICKIGQ